MSQFTDVTGESISDLTLVIGRKLVHFEEGHGATHITVSSNNSAVRVVGTTLFDGPKGIHSVRLTATAVGEATITGKTKDGQSSSLDIDVEAKLALPARNTTEGIVVRLLLAESMTPSDNQYDASDAEKGMKWMVVVLNNRLENPGEFGAPGGKTIEDIIKANAPAQFRGFASYPKYSAGIVQKIQTIVDFANDNNLGTQDEFQDHLKAALRIGENYKSPIPDPSPTELIGWRTSGSGSPGSGFTPFGPPILGIQFYRRPD